MGMMVLPDGSAPCHAPPQARADSRGLRGGACGSLAGRTGRRPAAVLGVGGPGDRWWARVAGSVTVPGAPALPGAAGLGGPAGSVASAS
jgi:hypothetical protein